MVMLRPKGKAMNIARKVLGKKGVKVPKEKNLVKTPQTPFLQH